MSTDKKLNPVSYGQSQTTTDNYGFKEPNMGITCGCCNELVAICFVLGISLHLWLTKQMAVMRYISLNDSLQQPPIRYKPLKKNTTHHDKKLFCKDFRGNKTDTCFDSIS
jgi:hypothetical protein